MIVSMRDIVTIDSHRQKTAPGVPEEVIAPIYDIGVKPHVKAGPLLLDFLAGAGGGLERYLQSGGYEITRHFLATQGAGEILAQLEAAGLRGRGGGGFPTGLKWSQVARSLAPDKYFICNANSGQPGGFKERFLLTENPHRALESLTLAALAVGAKTAFLFLGNALEEAEEGLRQALAEAEEAGFLGARAGGPELRIYRSPGGYVTGEETAIFELLEGRIGQPRSKPPLPTRRGLLGAPTVVNNLETVLQAYLVLKQGPERFRELGTPDAPGTVLFSLSGHIERPGLYELPLGTPLRELLFDHGGGLPEGRQLKAVLAGGMSSRLFGPGSLDIALDYDSMRDAGADLGSGVVIVISDEISAPDLAVAMAKFYHESSCGKCQPCKDGTGRVLAMLERLGELDQKSIDLKGRSRLPSPRQNGLTILQESGDPGGISYTDSAEGLDKIRILAEWYKFRGDCHHPTEAAGAIQSVLDLFHEELEAFRHQTGALDGNPPL